MKDIPSETHKNIIYVKQNMQTILTLYYYDCLQ